MKTIVLTILITLMYLVACPTATSQILKYVDADAAGGGDGEPGSPWNSLSLAIYKIRAEPPAGLGYTRFDEVILHIEDGPFDLGEEWNENEGLVPIIYQPADADPNGIPHLTIIGWDGGAQGQEQLQIIRGIDMADRVTTIGWSESNEVWTNLTSPWPTGDEYTFDWEYDLPPNFNLYENPPGQNNNFDWMSRVLNNFPDDSDHFGMYLIRREMLVAIDATTGEYYSFMPVYEDDIGDHDDDFYSITYMPAPTGGEDWDLDYLADNFEGTTSNWDLHMNTSGVGASGIDPRSDFLYVPFIGRLFSARQAPSITLKSLSFRFANPYEGNIIPSDDADWNKLTNAVEIKKCGNVVLENCDFQHINGVGLSISSCPARYNDDTGEYVFDYDIEEFSLWNYGSVTLNNVDFARCGLYGAEITKCYGVFMEDCDLEENNWLAYRAGTMRWACGTMKIYQVRHALLHDVTANNNWGRGLWFDQDNQSIQLYNYSSTGNYSSGLFLEASKGPFVLHWANLVDNSINLDNWIDHNPDDPTAIGGDRSGMKLNTIGMMHSFVSVFDQNGVDANDVLTFPVSINGVNRSGDNYHPLWEGEPQSLHMGENSWENCTFNAQYLGVGVDPYFIVPTPIGDEPALICDRFWLNYENLWPYWYVDTTRDYESARVEEWLENCEYPPPPPRTYRPIY